MSIISDNHDKTGTMILVRIRYALLADLAERVTRADLEGRDISLALEIEPAMHATAGLKAKIGEGTWSPKLGNVKVRSIPLYDI